MRAADDTITIQVPGQPPVTTTAAKLAKITRDMRRPGTVAHTVVQKVAAEARARGESASPMKAATAAAAAAGKDTIMPDDKAGRASRFAQDQLRSLVERIEKLEEEKKALSDDIKDVFAEAKGNGYDTKALRAVIRLRKQDKDERTEHEAILETYKAALGMM